MIRSLGKFTKLISREPLLLTPGPLTTSYNVKNAMMKDLGSRDVAFMGVIKSIQERLLAAAGVSREDGYACIFVQGSGTQGVEAMFSSAVPKNGKVLILNNGAYGDRQQQLCKYMNIEYETLSFEEDRAVDPEVVAKKLSEDSSFSHVAMVHHETTAGVLNPLQEVAAIVGRYPHMRLMVDAMSAFGGYDALMKEWGIHYLVSSSNKLFEGVPGFSYCLAHLESLNAVSGCARTLTSDLQQQHAAMEKTGQFRFTPPVHTMLAFDVALEEWELEGGVAGRAARYQQNYDVLVQGMTELGFRFYVPEEIRGFVITTIMVPNHPKWDFNAFYNGLSAKGWVIYPGKTTERPSFRIGTIGRIYPHEMRQFIHVVRDTLAEMGIATPLTEAPVEAEA